MNAIKVPHRWPIGYPGYVLGFKCREATERFIDNLRTEARRKGVNVTGYNDSHHSDGSRISIVVDSIWQSIEAHILQLLPIHFSGAVPNGWVFLVEVVRPKPGIPQDSGDNVDTLYSEALGLS
jgi:hypothetical protein